MPSKGIVPRALYSSRGIVSAWRLEMDWFSLASCLLLIATNASHIECKSAEKETWSKNSLVSGAWGQNPKAHGILSRAWRDQQLPLNGTLREQSLQNVQAWSKARNTSMQHGVNLFPFVGQDANKISNPLVSLTLDILSSKLQHTSQRSWRSWFCPRWGATKIF